MPEQFDPAWEYFEPDPEVAEVFAPEGSGFGVLGIEGRRIERDGALLGFRFGVGNPDSGRFRLARERRVREYGSVCRVLTCPQCGDQFLQDRPHRGTYCSHRCANTASARKVERLGDGCPCCGAGVVAANKNREQKVFCSKACKDRMHLRRLKKIRDADMIRPATHANLAVGSPVTINAPGDPHVHGCGATVEKLTEWGAHLLVRRESRGCDAPRHQPRWRALWSEMVPLPAAGEEIGFEPCKDCGSQLFRRDGKCLTCLNCGSAAGGCS